MTAYFDDRIAKHRAALDREAAYRISYNQLLDPREKLLSGAKSRAKRRGIAFDLTTADLLWPDACPVLGIPLDYSRKGRPASNSPSLDRIDNAVGYIRGNVIVVSNRANTLKSNATPQEIEMLAAFYGPDRKNIT